MVQTIRKGVLPAKTYYRQQSSAHVSHDESGRFTQDAIANYVAFNHLRNNDGIEVGHYQSGQGVPAGIGTYEI
jgi:hypothetical protein